MSRRLAVVLLVLLALAALALGSYVYGRYHCPPPDWWLRVFVRSGNYGCLRVVE